METRDFSLKLKSVTDEGTFSGLASTYGNTDLQGDIIQPGAYTRTLASQPASGLPLLWGHDALQPLGTAIMTDSKMGLVVNGKLLLADPNAARALLHMKSGAIRGLSIGFDIPDPASVAYDDMGRRILSQLRLFEVSIVACPANPMAQITNVKSLAQAERFILALHKSADAETLAHLHAIHDHVLSLLDDATPDDPDEDPDDDDYDELAQVVAELKAIAAKAQELATA